MLNDALTPARTLRDAYNAVDPTEPLQSGDRRYVDCQDVRGDEDVVAHMANAIVRSARHTHQLFTGHRGCGKSTELLRLRERLEREGLSVIYFEADEDLDLQDAVLSDLLLAIARRVESELRALGMPADDELLKHVERWFADTLYSEDEWRLVQRELSAEAGLGVPQIVSPFAQLAARITGQIKTGREVKQSIRSRLDPRIAQLIDNVNLLLRHAQVQVQKGGKAGLALIIDNLDRITLNDLGGGRTSHDALYIEHGEQLRALDCHVIYTVPISMFYAAKATILRGIFPDTHVLPMIRARLPRAKGGGESTEGLSKLRTILAERLDIDLLFEATAAEFLCQACGGHPRDLMILVRHAIDYAPNVMPRPISLEAARRAQARLVAAYSRMVPEAHYAKLATVFLRNRVLNDEDHQQMLYNLSVLEYANGLEPWHDVHPAVQKLSRFQQALEHEREQLFPGN